MNASSAFPSLSHAPQRLATALALIAIQANLAADAPPKAPERPVTNAYFGVKVTDPYRWMEAGGPEFDGWLHGQEDFTERTLARLPGRERLRARIHALNRGVDRVTKPTRVAGRWFYLKRSPDADEARLCARDGADGLERVLWDPAAHAEGGRHTAVDGFTPSPDGRLVLVAASLGGSENDTTRVVDADSGDLLPDQIPNDFSGFTWLPDGSGFFHLQSRSARPTERFDQVPCRLHRLRTDPKDDPVVLGIGHDPAVPLMPTDFPGVFLVPGSACALAVIGHGVQNECTLYTSDLGDLLAGRPRWVKAADVDDQVSGGDEFGGTGLALHGNDLYLLTHRRNPRYELVRTQAGAPDLAHATTIVLPGGDYVLREVWAAKDALYVRALDGGLSRLFRVSYGPASEATEVALPFPGKISELDGGPDRKGVTFVEEGWIHSPAVYAYDPDTARVSDAGLQPPDPADFSGMVAEEIQVNGLDGTRVPVSILHREGLLKDGRRPTLVEAYGSYGASEEPFFLPFLLAWLERGGVVAVAHVRGGGDRGEGWHRAGQGPYKHNTIEDFIAAAQFMCRDGYADHAHLTGLGTSAGGLAIGGVTVRRPDLFAAVLDRVGYSNALRLETQPAGAGNVPEFGSVATEDGFHALYAMDCYQQVEDGTAYPAALLTAGANDLRVAPWLPGKMAARLQAASSSHRPVLLRVDFDAGHGSLGSTAAQTEAEWTDNFSFLLWQTGDPEFQPHER